MICNIDIAYWKWEFLRRNEQYIQAYNYFCETTKIRNNPKIISIRATNIEIFGFWPPTDPSLSIAKKYFEVERLQKTKAVYLLFPQKPLLKTSCSLPKVAKIISQGFKKPSAVDYLTSIDQKLIYCGPPPKGCRIEFGGTLMEWEDNSKDKIGCVQIFTRDKTEVDELQFIDLRINRSAGRTAVKNSINQVLKRIPKSPHRVHNKAWALYDEYIKIYDLDKEGMPISQIAKCLKPDKYKEANEKRRKAGGLSTNNPIYKNTENGLEAAKSLVNGGYKYLS